jgi:hypothetical protein
MKAYIISSEYSGSAVAVVIADSEKGALEAYAKQFEGDFDIDDITAIEKPLIGSGEIFDKIKELSDEVQAFVEEAAGADL